MNTMQGDGGNGGGVCLICRSSSFDVSPVSSAAAFYIKKSSNSTFSSPLLSRQLHTYFLIRHVLELPSEQLVKYLRGCPNPENWIKICSNCDKNYVEKCVRIFGELLEVKRRFNGARAELIGAIKRSIDAENTAEVTDEDFGEDFEIPLDSILDIDSNIRQFVKNHEYFPLPSSENSTATIRCQAADPQHEIKEEPATQEPDAAHFGTRSDEESSFSWEDNDRFNEDSISEDSENDYDVDGNSGDDWKPDNLSDSSMEGPSISNVTPNPRATGLECQTCGRFLKTKNSLRTHMKLHQPQRRKELFPCKLCGIGLSQRCHLRRHMETVHNPHKNASSSIKLKYKLQKSLPQFKCEHCPSSFKTSAHLRKHEIVVHKTNFYECSKCPWKSSSYDQRSLKDHLFSIHGTLEEMASFTDQHPFRCSFEGCGQVFLRKGLLFSHERIHKPPQHECHICGATFKHREVFRRHLKMHESRGEKKYQCELCPARYARKDNLLAHMRRGVHKLPGVPDDNLEGTKRGYISRRQYKCSECELIFGWKSQLEGHLAKIHGGVGTVVTSEPTDKPKKKRKKKKEEPVDAKVRKNEGKRFHCETCGKKYKTKSSLLQHLATVHGKKDLLRFICSFDSCGKSFSKKIDLDNHEDIHKEPSHKCEDCGMMFSQRTGLISHRRRMHSKKEGPGKIKSIRHRLFCKKCCLTFPVRKGLEKHMEIVHGVKPVEGPESLQCTICKAPFLSRSALHTHVETVHERKLEACCDICGSVLGSRYYLKAHKAMVHNIGAEEYFRFPCTVEQCTKRFGTQGEMRTHIRLAHEKQRPFQCELCGKEVISKKNLGRHIKAMHTNRESKPFKCEECGKGFAIDQYLWLHMKTHQKKPPEDLLQL